MARRANPAVIGAFVVGALTLAVAGLVVFGGGRFFRLIKPAVAYFEGSVKGVAIGAPVTFQGAKIGAVTDVRVVVDAKSLKISTPVFFEIDASRLTETSGQKITFRQDAASFKLLVDRGLRAQLETQSFVTGQVGIALEFHPGTPVRLTGLSPEYTEMPTVQSDMQKLTETLQNLPIAEIMASAKDTLDSVRSLVQSPETAETLRSARAAVKRSEEALVAIEKLARNVDGQVAPMAAEVTATARSARSALAEAERTINQVGKSADAALVQAQGTLARLEPTVEVTLKDFQTLARGLDEKVTKLSTSLDRTLAGADDMMSDGSPVRASLVTALDELAEAAASIRTLANYLERNPNSLVFGKARAAQ
jgi:paraquat-inducible protein B